MQIRELDLKELSIAYDVVKQLRVDLSYKEFEDLIYDMRYMNYKMFGVFERDIVITYAGVAVQTTLKDRRYLAIFDIVTCRDYEDSVYTQMMKDYLSDYAKTCMCEKVVYLED